ncbi:MAG: type IV pilus assembly protein PilM [Solirubrobacterales bacterium]
MALSLGARKINSIVGLDIEAATVAATEVVTNGDISLGRSGVAAIPPGATREGEVSDSEALSGAIKELFAEHKLPRNVRVGIANQRVVVRTLRLPFIDDDKELDAAVRFQAQEDLAMPLEQSVFDWQRLRPNPELRAEGKMDVVVVAARREMVGDLVRVVRDAGLRPVGLDVSAFGLIRALSKDTDGIQPVASDPAAAADADATAPAPVSQAKLFCSLGDNTNLAVAREGDCLFTRVSTFGIEGIAQRLAERRELTLEHARQWLGHVGVEAPVETVEGDPAIVQTTRESLEDGVAKLADEMRLSLDYYGTQEGAVSIEEIVVCGPGAVIAGVPARLEQLLGYAIRVGRPPALAGLDAADAARLTLPFGLGLEE